ncbi:hypothetical protein UFOVP623_32 [uncultured Caudovirales phage]|uniref:Uncharacterized protein n=1 Tax=uncultured Caudovirales phage TaxID=2100421 RepID=A0A6J5N5T7_9CAUD|nr:hypothetical protein UFOVP623_32 [uncultured Caudovirales phage]
MASVINVTPASQVATVEVNNRQLDVTVVKEVKSVDITLETRGNINVDISRSMYVTGVQEIVAGNNITISNSTGIVTINSIQTSNVNYANNANRANSAATVDGWVKVPFTFSDASPKLITIIPANEVVTMVELIITTPFNDATSTISVGTNANPTELVNTTDNKPSILGSYTTSPGRIYLSDTHVVLTINPATSYTGSGMLNIYY